MIFTPVGMGKLFFFNFYFADLFYETGDSSLVLKLRMQYMQIINQVDAYFFFKVSK